MPAKLDRCVAQVKSDLRKRGGRYSGMSDKALTGHAFAICNASLSKGGALMEYGYLIKLDEGKVPEDINIFKVGKYPHPVHGMIDITPERLKRFADNVNNKVRGIDPDIDYEHKAKDGKAAGWVRSAEVKDDKLFVHVEWTDPARDAISKKEYRYLSPDFYDKWKDSEGKEHEDVLAGVALTNRPFLKDLVPLNFSEVARPDMAYQFGDDFYRFDNDNWIKLTDKEAEALPKPDDDGREGKLDPKKLAEILGLAEDTDEAKLLEEVTALKTLKDSQATDKDKAKKFAEEYPVEAKRLEEQNRRMVELEKTNKLMETDTRIKGWTEGKNSLPPAVHDQVRDFRMELDSDTSVKFDEIVEELHKTGLVDLDVEKGGSGDPTDQDAAKKFEDLIDKIYAEKKKDNDKFEYADAVKLAEKEEPELSKAYIRG